MKKALLIGINKYGNGLGQLEAAHDDARAMRDLLARHHDDSRNYECRLVTSEDRNTTERVALRREIQRLFRDAKGRQLLFYFAGHGASGVLGLELVTSDGRPDLWGIPIIEIVHQANTCGASEVILLLDCCHAGNAGNPAELQSFELAAELRQARALLSEGVTILAAARESQRAVEKGAPGEARHGAFTMLLREGLMGAAANVLGEVSVPSLYVFAAGAFGAFDQTPVFKSHVSQPAVIRRCPPRAPKPLIDAMMKLFPTEDFGYPVDPEHDDHLGGSGTARVKTDLTKKQEAYGTLRALRDGSLLALPPGMTLYECLYADSGKGCCVALSVTGRSLWRLARAERI